MFVFVLAFQSLPGKPHLIYWAASQYVVELAVCIAILPFEYLRQEILLGLLTRKEVTTRARIGLTVY